MSSRDSLDEIKRLDAMIEYEEAMLQSARDYPTDTAQFYNAMDKAAERIRELKKQRAKLKGDIDE